VRGVGGCGCALQQPAPAHAVAGSRTGRGAAEAARVGSVAIEGGGAAIARPGGRAVAPPLGVGVGMAVPGPNLASILRTMTRTLRGRSSQAWRSRTRASAAWRHRVFDKSLAMHVIQIAV